MILESAALAIRGAAFLVPGAVGVQEGGYTSPAICSAFLVKWRWRCHSFDACVN